MHNFHKEHVQLIYTQKLLLIVDNIRVCMYKLLKFNVIEIILKMNVGTNVFRKLTKLV